MKTHDRAVTDPDSEGLDRLRHSWRSTSLRFGAGVVLAIALGYWLADAQDRAAVAVVIAGAAAAISWRLQPDRTGWWLLLLGFAGFSSRIDPRIFDPSLERWRIPFIVGGSLVALVIGLAESLTSRSRREARGRS